MNIPERDCVMGYTDGRVQQIMGDRLEEFAWWMDGQTRAICEARRWNYDTQRYEPNGCDRPHGAITYECDVRRFLAGGEPLD